MFEFKWLNKAAFQKTFRAFADSMRDLSFMWEEVAAAFYKIEKAHFRSLGARGPHGAWPPLTAQYGAWKATHYPGKPLMQREGFLIASLTQKDAQYSIYKATSKTLTLGTSRPGAAAHQYSTRKPRRVVDLTPIDFKLLTLVAQRALTEQAKKAGFDQSGPGIRVSITAP